MVADPKPNSGFVIDHAEGTISMRDSYRPNILDGIDTFKTERWVEVVVFPKRKGFAGGPFQVLRKFIVSVPKIRCGVRPHSLSCSRGSVCPALRLSRADRADAIRSSDGESNLASHRISSEISLRYSRKCSTARSCTDFGSDSSILVTVSIVAVGIGYLTVSFA